MQWKKDGELSKQESQGMHIVDYIARNKAEMDVCYQYGVPRETKVTTPNKLEEKLITAPIFNLTYLRDKVSEVVTQSARGMIGFGMVIVIPIIGAKLDMANCILY